MIVFLFCNRSRVASGLTYFSVGKLPLGKIVDQQMGLTPFRIRDDRERLNFLEPSAVE